MQLPRLLYKASQAPEAWALESGRYALREVKDKIYLNSNAYYCTRPTMTSNFQQCSQSPATTEHES